MSDHVCEPQPGVMHPVDRAFYALTVAQRDRAWREVESVRADARALANAVEQWPDHPWIPGALFTPELRALVARHRTRGV